MKDNVEFFEALVEDPEFCRQLGRVTLASSRLEGRLILFLEQSGVEVSKRLTLGALVSKLEQKDLISTKGAMSLREVVAQRNYLTHSIFGLLAGSLEETLLPVEGLLESDVATYAQYAWELEDNLNGMIGIVESRLADLASLSDTDTGEFLLIP